MLISRDFIVFRDLPNPDNLLIKVFIDSKSDEFNIQLLSGDSKVYRSMDVVFSTPIQHSQTPETYIIKVFGSNLSVHRQSDQKLIYEKSDIHDVNGLRVTCFDSRMVIVCANHKCKKQWEKKQNYKPLWIVLSLLVFIGVIGGSSYYLYQKLYKKPLIKPL
jgi:hypothetical protein